METWTESCPLRGRCTECGLDFAWSEVLNPEVHEPKWCIEFAHQRRLLPIAAVKTFIRAWWPFSFWRRLRMSDRIHWRRIALFLFLLPVPVFFSYALEQTVVALRVRSLIQTQLDEMNAEYLRWSAQGDPQVVQNVQQTLAQTGVNHPIEHALLEAIFRPFSAGTTGTVTWPDVGLPQYPYVAPVNLHRALLREAPASTPDVEIETVVIPLLGWMIVLFLLPLSFALLPVSRRRAKVRWRHIMRVAAYSLFAPTAAVSLAFLLGAAGFLVPWPGVARRLLTVAVFVVPLGPGVMLLLWWWAAVSRYLRIPHGFLVALLLLMMCALLTVSVPFAMGLLLTEGLP